MMLQKIEIECGNKFSIAVVLWSHRQHKTKNEKLCRTSRILFDNIGLIST